MLAFELEFFADIFPVTILRMNAIGALGFASARAKSPAVAEGGNGWLGVPARFG